MSNEPPQDQQQPAAKQQKQQHISNGIELADGALDLLDMGDGARPQEPQSTADGAQTSSKNHAGAVDLQRKIIPAKLLASQSRSQHPDALTDGFFKHPTHGREVRLLPVVLALCTLIFAAVVYMQLGARSNATPIMDDTEEHRRARSRIAELLPKALPQAPGAQAHAAAPTPMPELAAAEPAQITAASLANIDQLDAASLAAIAEPDPKAASADDLDLFSWAQVRRILSMGDEAARPAVQKVLRAHAPPPQAAPLGHGRRRERARARRHRARAQIWERPEDHVLRPLEAAAFGGAALILSPNDRAERTLQVLQPLLQKTPQGQFVAALGHKLRRGSRGLRAQHESLTALAVRRPRMVDVQLATAQSHIDGGDLQAAMAILTPLAMEDAPDTWSRAAELMWQARQMVALSQVMARKLGAIADPSAEGAGALQTAHMVKQLVQASKAHRAIIRRLMVRHLLEEGDVATSLSWAMAQLQETPHGAASIWDALRLAHLSGSEQTAPLLRALVLTLSATPADVDLGALRKSMALTLLSGSWHHGAPDWLQAATSLTDTMAQQSAVPKLVRALQQERDGHRSEALRILRGVTLGHSEPQVVSTLTRAQVASLRSTDPQQRLSTLAHLVVPRACLSCDVLRPDVAEMALRTLHAAQDAHRPAQVQQAAQELMWLDPLAQHPLATLLDWAKSISELHFKQGGAAKDDPGLARMERLLAQHPGNDEIVRRTIALVEEQQKPLAIGLYQTLLLRHPNDPLLVSQLVDVYVALGQDDEAAKLMQPWAAEATLASQDANILYARALTLAATDRPQAKALLTRALAAKEPQARFASLMATLLLQQNQPDQALSALSRAIALDAHDLTLQLRKARLLLVLGQPRQADETAQSILQGNPTLRQQSDAWLLRADVAREANDAVKSAASLRQALLLGTPKDAVAMAMRLAKLELQELGQGEQALRHLQEIVTQAPNNAEAHYFLALALRDQNNPKRAKEAFLRYLDISPDGEFATDAKDALQALAR